MERVAIEALHEMLAPAGADEGAREGFWSDVVMYLEAEARAPLRDVYETRVRPALAQTLGRDPDRLEIAEAMRSEVENRFWYRLRTDAQRESGSATLAIIEGQKDRLIDRAKARSNGPGSLTLNPDLEIPDYLGGEIHLQAGGYYAETGPDDLTQGAVYDRGLTMGRMGTQGWLNDDPGRSLAAWVKSQFPAGRPSRALELGCTVGHTLVGMKAALPDCEFHGVDVAAPLLRYGFARAAGLGVDVHFHQQNAEHTRFPDQSFDLVYSRILMHETSLEAAKNIFAECRRLLKPGGLMFHSDAPQFDELDPYAASLRDWDFNVNNEPFMDGYYSLDLEAMYEAAGFERTRSFRCFTPSLAVHRGGEDPKRSRVNAGRYFLTGAWKGEDA